MNASVVIIGASGHGKVVADIILKSRDSIKGFLDDGDDKGDTFVGYPMLGKVDDYKKYVDCKFIIAIGNANVREKIAQKLRDVNWYTAIHPSVIISSIGVSIGEGSVLVANSVVNSCATVGKHCIVNTCASVGHDVIVEDFVHVSSGARIAGTSVIGARTWVGVGSTVKNNVNICSDCMLGAGTVVVNDIIERGTYIGCPSKKVK